MSRSGMPSTSQALIGIIVLFIIAAAATFLSRKLARTFEPDAGGIE